MNAFVACALVCLTLPITLAVSGCSHKPNQFDMVCDSFTKLSKLNNLEKTNSAERYEWLMNNILKSMDQQSDAVIAWQSKVNATPDVRYEEFQTAAQSQGLIGWQCDSMQRLAYRVGI
ncbi:hypothetical protein [Halioxenophilus sp. WMMB6]|uniref:hypothetical protein n=1 Tax=Halioxenophilus sp. WMMB6 TaxID=3073815 RepID=UPI00295EA0B1|nr:hypothetical protein [Halioxenophilus sp. WMMB6]